MVLVLTNQQWKQPFHEHVLVAHPCGVISGLSSLLQGSKSLGSTAEANVSLFYPPSESLQLVMHHMLPSENCHVQALFFLLLAAKVRSSCEEGPGQSALQSAYHDPQLDVTELNQHRTT